MYYEWMYEWIFIWSAFLGSVNFSWILLLYISWIFLLTISLESIQFILNIYLERIFLLNIYRVFLLIAYFSWERISPEYSLESIFLLKAYFSWEHISLESIIISLEYCSWEYISLEYCSWELFLLNISRVVLLRAYPPPPPYGCAAPAVTPCPQVPAFRHARLTWVRMRGSKHCICAAAGVIYDNPRPQRRPLSRSRDVANSRLGTRHVVLILTVRTRRTLEKWRAN